MIIFLVTVFFAIANALRGAGVIPRAVAALGMGLVAGAAACKVNGLSIAGSVDLFCIPVLCLWGSFSFGWGKYFAVFTGNMATIPETEVKPIDWIVNKLLGVPKTIGELKRWSLLAMSLRGSMFYPLFAMLGLYHPIAFLYGTGTVLMGPVYGLMNYLPEKLKPHSIRIAEVLYGALLGILTTFSVAY